MTNATAEAQSAEKPLTTQPAQPADIEEELDGLRDLFSMRPLWRLGRPFRSLLREPAFPAMDVYTKDGKLEVRVELPGMTAKDVEISVEAGTLVVSGQKTQSKEVKEKDYYRSEREYGSFYRRIALPSGADVDHVTAEFKDGVLEIDVPLQGAPAGKKIAIKPSNAA